MQTAVKSCYKDLPVRGVPFGFAQESPFGFVQETLVEP
jgi:hypothetical protein